MKKLFVMLIGLIFLASCQEPAPIETKEIVKYNLYSVEIPVFLNEATFHEEASLQYMNEKKGLAVMVLDYTKDAFNTAYNTEDMEEAIPVDLNSYFKFLANENYGVSEEDALDTTINNLNAKFFNTERFFEGELYYYSGAFIEGKDRFYQLVVLAPISKKDKYKALMRQIIFSFKEI